MASFSNRRLRILYGIAIAAGPVILAVAVYMGFMFSFDWEVVSAAEGDGRTPNPSKSPGCWLTLQEMWVYADPFLVDRILPILVPLASGTGGALVVWGLIGSRTTTTPTATEPLPGRHYVIAGLLVLFGSVGPYLAAMVAAGLILLRAP